MPSSSGFRWLVAPVAIGIDVDLDRLHLFDAATGVTLDRLAIPDEVIEPAARLAAGAPPQQELSSVG